MARLVQICRDGLIHEYGIKAMAMKQLRQLVEVSRLALASAALIKTHCNAVPQLLSGDDSLRTSARLRTFARFFGTIEVSVESKPALDLKA